MTPLINLLLEQDLVPVGTVLTVRTMAKNNLGMNINQTRDMVLEKLAVRGEEHVLLLADHEKRVTATTSSPEDVFDILAIDGMSADRFADLYNINPDGSSKRVGKKRGRKCKVRG